jgi:hypothetical protein
MNMNTVSYVYTMGAARSRLKRGHRSVRVFLPRNGRLMKVTKGNWKSSLATFKRAEKFGLNECRFENA